jgi:hypothetical protein
VFDFNIIAKQIYKYKKFHLSIDNSGHQLITQIWSSRDHVAGRSHTLKTDNSSSDWVEEFEYLGTSLTNKILFRKKLRAD